MNSGMIIRRYIVNKSFVIRPPVDHKTKLAKQSFVKNSPVYTEATTSSYAAGNSDGNSDIRTSTYQRDPSSRQRYQPDAYLGPRKNRGVYQVLDPFAVKISIPPLVLLGYVIYRWYTDTDIRFRLIHSAENRHLELMEEISDEVTTSSILKQMT